MNRIQINFSHVPYEAIHHQQPPGPPPPYTKARQGPGNNPCTFGSGLLSLKVGCTPNGHTSLTQPPSGVVPGGGIHMYVAHTPTVFHTPTTQPVCARHCSQHSCTEPAGAKW